MNKIRILSFLMVVILVAVMAVGCFNKDENPQNTTEPSGNNTPVVYQDIDLKDAIKRTDFTSVYSKIGANITIADVTETPDGLAYVTVDGKKYDLGMDFLSMAMVYNTKVPEGSTKYQTEEDVYNEWWKLYIQRWNYLAPEVPLYSNQYFDLYNAKLQNFVTSPYWDPADAIIAASVKAGAANSVILGSATELSGAFRSSSWGKSSPGSADLDIENLTSGHATVQTDKNGAMIWNEYVVNGTPTSKVNEDGTLTYTIKIKEGLKFSDGSAVKAENYIVSLLANSTPVAAAAGGSDRAGMQLIGFDEFNKGTSKFFKGVQLLDDYTFAVTFLADYAGYYYAMSYASFSPVPMALYTGDNTVTITKDANNCCGLSDNFYAQVEKDGTQVYVQAEKIVANLKWNSNLPYSGPYVVHNYDASTLIATLKLNPNYSGDTARGKASIETITYIKIESETQTDKFKAGEVDVLAGITGATETVAALELVKSDPTKYAETHYDRAGYGKLGFRADFGPTGFTAVRQAIMYTINRNQFAQDFTGGYGSVVHGPYYTGYSAYKAVENTIKLNAYTYSKDSAIEALEEGGWIYNVEGKTFDASKDKVRYKKLAGYELTEENIQFKSTDSKYKTVKIDGEYYMPLAINWFGTQPNDVTDMLIVAWQESKTATEEIGMYITYTSTDFTTGLYGELSWIPDYGFDGTPKLNAINFATGFTSALYDYSWNWTIDPDMYDDYSVCYVMDSADFWADYQ